MMLQFIRWTCAAAVLVAPRVAYAQAIADSAEYCATVTIEHDALDGTTSLKTERSNLPITDTELSLHVESAGRTLRTSSSIAGFFITTGKGWRFLDYHPVVLMLDATTRLRPRTRIDTEVLSGATTYENVIATFSLSQAEMIGRAKKVVGRLGTQDFEFRPAHIAAFRGAAAALRRRDGEGSRTVCVQ